MKKQYSKPGIIIEDFKVAEHIASCTGVKHDNYWGHPLLTSPTDCEWYGSDGVKIFTFEKVCTEQWSESGDPGYFEGFCYNGAAGGWSVFGS